MAHAHSTSQPEQEAQGIMTTPGLPLSALIEVFLQPQTSSAEESARLEQEEDAEEQARQALRDEYQRLLAQDARLREASGTRSISDPIDEDRGEL